MHKESLLVLLAPREVASTLRVDLSTVYRMIDAARSAPFSSVAPGTR